MAKTLLNASVVMLLAAGAAAAQTQSSGVSEKEVLQALYAVDQADDKRDKAAMERLVADDFLYHGSNGTILNKAQNIAETIAGETMWTGRKYDGLKVRIYGDLAVITGTVTLTGKSNAYRVGARRITRLFVKRDGRWQDLGGQATLVPEK